MLRNRPPSQRDGFRPASHSSLRGRTSGREPTVANGGEVRREKHPAAPPKWASRRPCVALPASARDHRDSARGTTRQVVEISHTRWIGILPQALATGREKSAQRLRLNRAAAVEQERRGQTACLCARSTGARSLPAPCRRPELSCRTFARPSPKRYKPSVFASGLNRRSGMKS